MLKKIVFLFLCIVCSASLFSEDMNDKEILDLINQMTLEQKVSLVHASSIFENGSVPELGLPSIVMSDGPHGVRWETGPSWIKARHPHNAVTYLPPLTALAATWNTSLAYRFGEVLGVEGKSRGKTMMLGPGVNIMRTPLNGRNFEYMGEDPYLAGVMASSEIRGLQSKGIAACIKHFALNNQEKRRKSVNVEIDERGLREIYLPAFKRAIKTADVLSIMPAYNRFRGEFCAESSYLLNKILRDEWGFLGVAVSDWGAVHNTETAAAMSLDIEMGTLTSAGSWNRYWLADPYLKGLKFGKYPVADLNRKVYHIIYLLKQTGLLGLKKVPASSDEKINLPEHQQTALDVARESIVLLNNQKNLLPLPDGNIKILVVGESADKEVSDSGGSSNIESFYEKTILDGLKEYAHHHSEVEIIYEKGYSGNLTNLILAGKAVKKASEADYVLFCGGLDHSWAKEAEGSDRKRYNLPSNQIYLLNRLLAVNPNTIVSVTAGTPVGFGMLKEKIHTLFYSWYNGMEGGKAFAEVLFGEVNPSGALPFTIAETLRDYPAHNSRNTYPGMSGTVEYSESIFNGYRFFLENREEVLFPFGYGLSYTRFDYSDLKASFTGNQGDVVKVTVDVTNQGDVAGKTIVQVYVKDSNASLERPEKELKGFVKVRLEAGERRTVSIDLDRDSFMFYSPDKGWIAEPGAFIIYAGENSFDDSLKTQITIDDFSGMKKGIN